MELNKIYNHDCLEGLKTIMDNSVDCCVTSPPYYGLRDYGVSGQIGLEETPEKFIEKIKEVFQQVKRVLKHEGTLWLNLGDSYASGKVGRDDMNEEGRKRISKFGHPGLGVKDQTPIMKTAIRKPAKGLKPKDLIGIPWMAAFALRSLGYYWRDTIIWHKPNPMPESVKDRTTKSHEYILMFSKSSNYYYDQDSIRTPVKDSTVQRLLQQVEDQKGSDRIPGKTNGNMKAVGPGKIIRKGVDTRGGNQGSEKGIPAMAINGSGVKGHSGNFDSEGNLIGTGYANKKSVWTVTTKPFKEANFATFPEDLIVDCIKAGCPENGIVLDPFMGGGTTALVSRKLNRNFIGFELNPQYIKIAERRLEKHLGLFI